jgi:hypothetical protein
MEGIQINISYYFCCYLVFAKLIQQDLGHYFKSLEELTIIRPVS